MGFENQGTQGPSSASGQAITIGSGSTGILIQDVILSDNGQSGGNATLLILANSSVTINGGGGMCNVWKTMYTGGVEVQGSGVTLNISNYVFAYNFKGGFDGGGLLIKSGNATTVVNINNCYFANNESTDGGAISQRVGVLNVTDCVFENNYAGQTSTTIYGGAVIMKGGTATYTNCSFLNNGGNGDGTIKGGAFGLYSQSGVVNLTLNSCYFNNNSAAEGTDIYEDESFGTNINVTATNTTFSSSTYSIFNKDANTVQLTNCGNPTVSGSVNKVNTTSPTAYTAPAVPGFTGTCASGITLPVVLTSFTSQCLNGGVQLKWQTETEINNDYFVIEKAGQNLFFEPIGEVDGAGNSSIVVNYNFTDDEYNESIVYYRLKQVDYNGEFTYSEITSSECAVNQEGELLIYPNPASNEITLSLGRSNDVELNGQIVSVLGKNVMNFSFSNYEKLRLSIENLSRGLYNVSIYSVRTGEMVSTTKFIKQ